MTAYFEHAAPTELGLCADRTAINIALLTELNSLRAIATVFNPFVVSK